MSLKDTQQTKPTQVSSDASAKSTGNEERTAQIKAVLRSHKLSHAKLAEQLKVSKQDVGSWVNGKFEKLGKRALGDLNRWYDVFKRRADKAAAQAGFVETATAERIIGVFAYCHDERSLGAVYGGAGVGKTYAARYYQSLYARNVFIMTASPEVSTVHPMLEELSRALGLEEQLGGSRALSRACRAFLARAKRPLLIIDEAQHLSLSALESIRSIQDEVECGLVLMGNVMVYERLTGGTRAAHFAQLFSRVAIQAHIKAPTRDDVHQIIETRGLKDAPAIDALITISKRGGALRAVSRVLSLSVKAADGNVMRVRIEHVRLAARNLGIEIIL
jgi:DNA transposition AAA+ family ATPase